MYKAKNAAATTDNRRPLYLLMTEFDECIRKLKDLNFVSDIRLPANELEERLRSNNIFNIGDVEYAILETSGQITVIPKPEKRNVVVKDFNLEPEYEGISYDLVIDGVIMKENLRKLGKDEKWLEKQVAKFKIKPKDALVVTIDGEGQFFCQAKERKSKNV